ncbi:hypothetical protein B0T22DRAFT_157838 [Podospora appendiculata]|uniref:RING-type domain-containing protein n=1 Tax=Podospora appendiculata TaxID=314037 RepID=A0AAE0X9M1_9PEZI|nr:hypothetical protein B0T22DRAFT_157838 [Podospora appendiculata]
MPHQVARFDQESHARCFIPCPRLTFLIHKPDNLVCQICQETRLTFASHRNTTTEWADNTPAILPCGHVFGFRCLERWLQISNTCAICRLAIRYECGHRIPPVAITAGTVLFLPRTIPYGGTIPSKCTQCSITTGNLAPVDLVEGWARARRLYVETGEKEWIDVCIIHLNRIEAALRDRLPGCFSW